VSDQFVRVTRTSWLGNIMNSFVGVLIGIILFVVAFPVLWFNEGRTNMATVAKSSVSVNGASVDQSAEGKQVAVAGTLASDQLLGDTPYFQPGAYIQLNRNAEMYAWVEKKESETKKEVGGSSTTKTTYTYEKQWTSSPENSNSFEVSAGHTNPSMAVKSDTFVVSSARVSAYSIDPGEISLPSATEIKLNADNTAGADSQKLAGNYLFMGKGSIDNPQLGDIRISYSGVPAGINVTAFGKQQGSALVPYVTRNDDRLYRVFQTDRDGAIAQMNTEYQVIGWVLRLVGFLLMWIGLSMCFGPINAVLDVLPFLGSASRFLIGIVALPIALVLSIITIVISVLAHNILALIIVLGLIVGGVMLWSRVQKARSGPAAA
jgi:transmembrane protein TMEM43